MSRARKAAVSAAFAYVQFGMAIVSGIVLVPLILRHLGTRNYGLWLATGELLAYAVMIDLGVLGVLPWMLAEADGRRDRAEMRQLLSNGCAVGVIVGLAYGVLALVLWALVPSALRLTASDRAIVGPALAIVVVATTIGYPLRVFRAALGGLQDAAWNGFLSMVQSVANVVLTIVLLAKGYGIYALAYAMAGSSILVYVLGAFRLFTIAPDLMRGWDRPTLHGIRPLLVNGLGVWLAAFGWQLLAASNGIVIAYISHPEWVPIYMCTAKVSLMCMQLAWVLPDNALIGLAQLHGERRSANRVTEVVGSLLQLHLLMAGAAMCGVLAFNPAFVARWVGDPLFGGLSLNAWLAVAIVVSSFVHGLITTASVVGSRLEVGIVTLVNGALQLPCAIFLGHRFGLLGVAAATVITSIVTSLPAGIVLLRRTTMLNFRSVALTLVAPWLVRVAPLALVATLIGSLYHSMGIWPTTIATVLLSLAYLWQMRRLYPTLPLDPRVSRWLISLRLLPPITAPASTEPAS